MKDHAKAAVSILCRRSRCQCGSSGLIELVIGARCKSLSRNFSWLITCLKLPTFNRCCTRVISVKQHENLVAAPCDDEKLHSSSPRHSATGRTASGGINVVRGAACGTAATVGRRPPIVGHPVCWDVRHTLWLHLSRNGYGIQSVCRTSIGKRTAKKRRGGRGIRSGRFHPGDSIRMISPGGFDPGDSIRAIRSE